MTRLVAAAVALVLCVNVLSAQEGDVDNRFAIVPRPVSLTPRSGEFTFDANTVITADSAFARVAQTFARELSQPAGFDISVASRSNDQRSSSVVQLVHDASLTRLGSEGYTLSVTPTAITVRAAAPAGAFYALQTLRQLMPAHTYRRTPIGAASWRIPAVDIEDKPRFSWRGMHLDVSRHFMPKEFVRKYIDLLALHKMNRFHWHLTEDQGWRIEIRQYPKLTAVGSCRAQTLVGPYVSDPAKRVFDGKPHCGYYSQDDIREIVAYAAERFITVMPEIEMPGHAQAAIAAYPELGVRTDTTVTPMEIWGVSPFILNAEPSTIAFMQNVLGEVLELFPSEFIHIGGDEAIKDQWKASARIQQRINELGLKDEHELQSWFIRQMDSYLTARGRRLVGWDEILEGGLAENATVMSWRGMNPGIAAARAGHDVVMAPTSHTYFDYAQSRDRSREPLSFGGFIPLERVYAFEPMPSDSLTADQQRHILGAQAQLWTEYIPNPKHAEYMLLPRLSALSEVVWTPPELKSYDGFMQRMRAHFLRLDALDVNYRRP